MPNWVSNGLTIEGTKSEVTEFANILMYTLEGGQKKVISFHSTLPLPESESENWYTWQVENWGTKWDVHRDHIEWGDDDEDYCVIHFDTAWSPPEEIAAELKEKYDRVSVQWFYDEPGMEFAGYL